jgi:hypothetical protein
MPIHVYFGLNSNSQSEGKKSYVWYLINYILFLVLVQQITYKNYIQLPRMSKIMEGRVTFPTPVFLCGTAF